MQNLTESPLSELCSSSACRDFCFLVWFTFLNVLNVSITPLHVKKNTYIMKYSLITHCAGCLWCVVRRGHARPSKWHTVTSSSWQTNFDYWCVITSRRGVRHSPDFHETAVHKVLANLICPSRYFQKQPVSPSAKQWERPQDNKISPGRAWWGGPEEGARGGCTYDDPANARYRPSKPSLLVIIHLTSLRKVLKGSTLSQLL